MPPGPSHRLRSVSLLTGLFLMAGATPALPQEGFTPEQVVAAHLRSRLILTHPIKLDAREFHARADRPGEFGAVRDSTRSVLIANELDAKVQTLDEVRICDSGDPARGIPPWATCRLVGAESFVGISEPTINGDRAVVDVLVWRSLGNSMRPLSGTHYEIILKRSGRAWEVESVEVKAVT